MNRRRLHHMPAGRISSGAWAVQKADWTLRPQDLPGLIGREAWISDHPGIVVDLVFRAAHGS